MLVARICWVNYNVGLWQIRRKGNIKRLSVLKPKWAWSWQGNTTANGIARALSGCRSAIGQFGAKICAPIRRSLHVVTISVMRRRKKREGTCLIKCPSTRIVIVLKTESSFSPFKAFRHQKCRFSKNGPQSGVFSSNASLLETLVSLRNRTAGRRGCKMLVCDKRGRAITYVFCHDLQFKGKWSLAKSYLKTKLLLRLSQKVCGLLTSPVLLRKFSLKVRGRAAAGKTSL